MSLELASPGGRASALTVPAHDRGGGEAAQTVTHRWYTLFIATSHPRIQVTEDPELARALRAAAPHLRPGLPRSQQVRELALVGARHLVEEPMTEERRQELIERLISHFEHPETAPWDWDLLRDVKRRAWRFG